MLKQTVLFLRIAPFLLARAPHPRDMIWPVSLLYTRSILEQQGITAQVVDTWPRVCAPSALVRQVQEVDPEFLFLETRSPTADLTLELAGRIHRLCPGTHIWAIGQHASEKPDDFLFEQSPFTGCINGEIEPVVPAVVNGGQKIEGTVLWDSGTGALKRYGSRATLADPDALPILDPVGMDLDRYRMLSLHVPSVRRPRWGYLLTSRGCSYRCIFCSPTLRQSYGKTFRGQSPERVAEEMAFLNRRYGVDAFYATDDLFTADRHRVHGICEAILERDLKVKWTIQTRMDHLSRELLVHLKEAGCVGIKVGIETGSKRISEILNKNLDQQKVLDMSREMTKLGINLTACYLVGNPTESLSEMRETFEFAKKIGALMIQVAYHTPYPGSESFERYAARGPVVGKSHFDGSPLNLSNVSDAELVRFHRNFYLRYYLSPGQFLRYVRRRAVYKLFRAEELRLLASTTGYLLHQGLKRKAGLSNAHPLET